MTISPFIHWNCVLSPKNVCFFCSHVVQFSIDFATFLFIKYTKKRKKHPTKQKRPYWTKNQPYIAYLFIIISRVY